MPHLRVLAPLGLSLTLSSSLLLLAPGRSLAAPQAPPASPADPASPSPVQETTAPAPAAPEAAAEPAPPPVTASSLFKDGRARCRSKQYEPCIALLRSAIEQAEREGISGEERALIHYVLGLALDHEDEAEKALAELRRAAQLAPADAEIQLALAQGLQTAEEHAAAKTAAQRALSLGLSEADDVTQAKSIAKKASSALLHERLSLDLSISFGYDSNVLQTATRETIAGRNLATSKRPGATLTPREMLAEMLLTNATLATNVYTGRVGPGPKAEQAEFDLPLTLYGELGGRLYGSSRFELWLGYRFYQLIVPSVKFDHDSYSTQEHTFPVSMMIRPLSFWRITARFDGYVNLTGLSDIAPFQGGFLAALDQTFIESARFRTRIVYQHQLRRTIDRSDDVTYLDADRDDVKIMQELRLKGSRVQARGVLGYRFRSDRYAGPLELDYELSPAVTACSTAPPTGQLCEIRPTYSYRAPLTYQGHEAALRFRLMVPLGFELGTALSYEYRRYADEYTADYSLREVNYTVEQRTMLKTDQSYRVTSTPARNIAPVARRDHLIYTEVSLTKSLPHGVGLDLTYGFTRNLSNVVNFIDNRSYSKHAIILTASYSF